MNKYPEKLPTIDWEFYRNNVQKEAVPLVNTFEIEYKELDYVFASRHSTLDFSKYYTEWKELLKEAQEEVKEYIEASKERVECLEEEIKRLMDTPPFVDMTMEQFVITREDISESVPCQGRPIFWPPFEEIPDVKSPNLPKKEGKSKDAEESKGTGASSNQKELNASKESSQEDKQDKDEKPKETKDK